MNRAFIAILCLAAASSEAAVRKTVDLCFSVPAFRVAEAGKPSPPLPLNELKAIKFGVDGKWMRTLTPSPNAYGNQHLTYTFYDFRMDRVIWLQAVDTKDVVSSITKVKIGDALSGDCR